MSSRASIASAWRGRSFLWKNTTGIHWKTARNRESICTKTSEAVERYYHLSTICFARSWVRILAGSLMRMKMHFIQVRHFQREQMVKSRRQKYSWSKRTVRNWRSREIRQYRNWRHLRSHSGSRSLSVSKRCWIRIAELIVRQDMVILSSFCELLRDGRSHSARYLHQRESRSIQHLEQDILQHRKWWRFWIISAYAIIQCRIFRWQVYCILQSEVAIHRNLR